MNKIATWVNGERAIVLAIQKQPDANTVAVVDGVLAKLPALRAQIPPSISINVLMDRSVSIRQAVSDVEETLLIAVTLVILVIFLFLARSASATFIPRVGRADLGCSAPCAVMYMAGLLHQQHDAAGADPVGGTLSLTTPSSCWKISFAISQHGMKPYERRP